jgi:hypothetical protein
MAQILSLGRYEFELENQIVIKEINTVSLKKAQLGKIENVAGSV